MKRFDESIQICEQFLVQEHFFPLHTLLFPSFFVSSEEFNDEYPPVRLDSYEREILSQTLQETVKEINLLSDQADDNKTQMTLTMQQYTMNLAPKFVKLIEEIKNELQQDTISNKENEEDNSIARE